MKFFAQFWNTIKPTVLRFPAAFFLSALASIFAALCVTNSVSDEDFLPVIKSAFWAFAFSIFARLLLERLLSSFERKNFVFLASQIACLIFAFFPGYFLCRADSERFFVAYGGTICALFAACLFLLSFSQESEKIVPNIVSAAVISSIMALCIGAGSCVVALAVDYLIYDFDSMNVYLTIWCISCGFFFPCVFVSYATKSGGEISIPKTYKVIVFYALFSIYAVLLLVLYIYLLKNLISLNIPSGKINPFVSAATALFLFFYLSLESYKNRILQFFYSFGSIFLLVLISAQIAAFAVRIRAYGFTPVRCASFYYILFSAVFCALPLFKNARFVQKKRSGKITRILMNAVLFPNRSIYLIFAVCCLAASVSPLNIIDSACRNQYGRIVSTLKKYGLYKNGGIVPAPSKDAISDDDRENIVRATRILRRFDENGEFGAVSSENWNRFFEDKFGFPIYSSTIESAQIEEIEHFFYNLDVPESESVNIAGFSELFYFWSQDSIYDGEMKISVTFGENYKIDITDEILPLLRKKEYSQESEIDSKEPLVIKKDGFALIIRELNAKEHRKSGKLSYGHFKIIGYACR